MNDDFHERLRRHIGEIMRKDIEDMFAKTASERAGKARARQEAKKHQKKAMLEVFRMAFPDMSEDADIIPVKENPVNMLTHKITLQAYTIIDANYGYIYEFTAACRPHILGDSVFVLVIEVEGGEAYYTITKRVDNEEEEKGNRHLPSQAGDQA